MFTGLIGNVLQVSAIYRGRIRLLNGFTMTANQACLRMGSYKVWIARAHRDCPWYIDHAYKTM